MKIISPYIFLFIVLILISCGKERSVNITIPYDGNKIVLNSILMSDSIVYARITKSASSQSVSDSLTELSGCKVDLYENAAFRETLTETLINNKKYYISKTKTLAPNTYSIKVSGINLKNAEGADQIPLKPSFLPFEFWKIANPPDSIKPYRMTLKLKDPASEKNYYRLRVFPATYNSSTKRYTINKNSEISFSLDNFKDDKGFFSLIDDNLAKIVYFTDDTFNGQEVTLTLSLRTTSSERIYVAPELVALTRQSYLYFDTQQKQENNNNNPFAEAVIVYTNINGGYGIVGGMADSLAVIKRLN